MQISSHLMPKRAFDGHIQTIEPDFRLESGLHPVPHRRPRFLPSLAMCSTYAANHTVFVILCFIMCYYLMEDSLSGAVEAHSWHNSMCALTFILSPVSHHSSTFY